MVSIREANKNDVSDLAFLMKELGFPTTIEKMELRFNHIQSNSNYHTLVAEENSKIIGMIGLFTGLLYNKDGIYCRVISFVVDSKIRNKGVGNLLIQEAEKWAKNQGAIYIGLNSGNQLDRLDAHEFYKRSGYKADSTGFVKTLCN
ncbi:GNAT family N-acetyltransferase [Gottfriedia sp. NPDC056225]|uniref:GNAT family N-acetyltransferase n=1 Tax=Gottfriedia sp. NPDC056225 TaxID=3345751 RepID=UPI0035D88808